MISVENRTPFPAELVSLFDKQGREVKVLIIVATFRSEKNGQSSLAEEQEGICFADQHRGDPIGSSVVRESDVCPPKRFVDVLVDGFAYAPGGRPAESVLVGLTAAEIRKELRVTGDRPVSGRTVPFQKMPIIYERALGGKPKDKSAAISRLNPIGVGFHNAAPSDPEIATTLPNIEYASGAGRHTPAGFGVIGRGWSPRIELAGTYDAEWLEHQWPLLPKDFDDRHYQCAPADQHSKTITAGDVVRLTNVTPNGKWEFKLPRLEVPVHMIRADGPGTLTMRLDTIYLRPETRTIVMCHRAIVESGNRSSECRELVIGHMTAGWLNARCTKRHYLDTAETGGERRDLPLFS